MKERLRETRPDKGPILGKCGTIVLAVTLTMLLVSCSGKDADGNTKEHGIVIRDHAHKQVRPKKRIKDTTLRDIARKIRGEKQDGLYSLDGENTQVSEDDSSVNVGAYANAKAPETIKEEFPHLLEGHINSAGEVKDMRALLVDFCYEMEGKIPYYWAGRAESKGFAANNFGTTISPDYKGRNKKGSDCSGTMNWIFRALDIPQVWTNTYSMGTDVKTVTREELQPGDLGLRKAPGQGGNHVGLYVGDNKWFHNSSTKVMTVITEYSGFTHFKSPDVFRELEDGTYEPPEE